MGKASSHKKVVQEHEKTPEIEPYDKTYLICSMKLAEGGKRTKKKKASQIKL